jgi:hypothetical protein
MLYREIIAVCSEIHKKQQDVKRLNIKPGDIKCNHRALKGRYVNYIQIFVRLRSKGSASWCSFAKEVRRITNST